MKSSAFLSIRFARFRRRGLALRQDASGGDRFGNTLPKSVSLVTLISNRKFCRSTHYYVDPSTAAIGVTDGSPMFNWPCSILMEINPDRVDNDDHIVVVVVSK